MRVLKIRYSERLRTIPQPGQGRHTALLSIANLGTLAGIDPEQIHQDIQRALSGGPSMSDGEIKAAISKAAAEHLAKDVHYRIPLKPRPIITSGQVALRRIIDQGAISEDVDFWEASPIRLMDAPEKDPMLLLDTLFAPDDLLFIGDRLEPGVFGQNIRPATAWRTFFENGGTAGPFIMLNPLSGAPAPKKDGGGETYRGDRNIRTFRHCLVEFDNQSREDQIRFWSAAKLPILALIDSGGKSIHAWLSVHKLSICLSTHEWHQNIKVGLYDKVLVPLGVDKACSNPSRLSRLPGCLRAETGRYQRLLWLSPDGREVAP